MANWQVISLDTTTPQLRAPGTGDGYSFNSGSTQLGVWTTTGLGVGTAPDSALHVNSGSGATRAQLRVGYIGSSLNYYDANSHYFRDGSGASDRLTIISTGNVGIGTASPATKLHVAAGNVTIDNAYGYLAADNAGTRESLLSISSGNNVTVAAPTLSGSIQYQVRNASGLHQFLIGGTERARIDSVGRLLVGGTSAVYASNNGAIEVQNTNTAILNAGRFAASSGGPTLSLLKSRNATVGGNTIVVDGDTLGDVAFVGANGTGYDEAARIRASVDGTPGASADMPGRLVFATTADGSGSPTERMRINNAGNVSIGLAASADARLQLHDTAGGGDLPRLRFTNGGTGTGATDGMFVGISNTSQLDIWNFENDSVRIATNNALRVVVSGAGNVVVNTAAVATTATDGFLYIPTCAGAPTGVPTTFTGRSPLVVDSTNNRFYVYVNGAWKYATLT